MKRTVLDQCVRWFKKNYPFPIYRVSSTGYMILMKSPLFVSRGKDEFYLAEVMGFKTLYPKSLSEFIAIINEIKPRI